MKTMIAKYYGICASCQQSIHKGSKIVYDRSSRSAVHYECASEENRKDEDEAAGLEPGTLANDRQLAKRGLFVVRFASGEVMTQNSRGRCEDAPCCGCCS